MKGAWSFPHRRVFLCPCNGDLFLPSSSGLSLPFERGLSLPSSKGLILPSSRRLSLPSKRGLFRPSSTGLLLLLEEVRSSLRGDSASAHRKGLECFAYLGSVSSSSDGCVSTRNEGSHFSLYEEFRYFRAFVPGLGCPSSSEF